MMLDDTQCQQLAPSWVCIIRVRPLGTADALSIYSS
jgi:hypothetical protein